MILREVQTNGDYVVVPAHVGDDVSSVQLKPGNPPVVTTDVLCSSSHDSSVVEVLQ